MSFITRSCSNMYSKMNQVTKNDIDENQFTPIYK